MDRAKRREVERQYRKMYNNLTELSRREMKFFASECFPNHDIQWFHRIVLEYLHRWAVGDIKKLAIFMPPQHGKSWMSSVVAPGYILGKKPKAKIVCASYVEGVASKFNRLTQDLISGNRYKEIFPDTKIPSIEYDTVNELKNSKYFETIGHKGFYKAVGVGGSLTSDTVEYGIIDDPIKDRKQANSATYRESLWNWYVDVWRTRLNNDSRELMLFTRWHQDDLAGRIFDPKNEKYDPDIAKQFTVITLPALKEDVPPAIKQSVKIGDPRKIGEALWEAKHSKATHEADSKINPYGFASLKQQRPAPLEGGLIERDWFDIMDESAIPYNPETLPYNFMIDGAFSKKTENDPSAHMRYQVHKGILYIWHCESVWYKLPKYLRFIRGYLEETGYDMRSKFKIEPKSSGEALVDLLAEEQYGSFNTQEMNSMHVSWGKEERGHSASPSLAAGKVKLIKGPWNAAFIAQCCTFPNDTHDDMFDLLCYAILEELASPMFRVIETEVNL